MNLAAQRAVNAKAYLVQQQGIDPSRVEVRQGTGQQKVADIIWVPQGADENACADLQNTTPVDESVVKPSENAYPKARDGAPSTSWGIGSCSVTRMPFEGQPERRLAFFFIADVRHRIRLPPWTGPLVYDTRWRNMAIAQVTRSRSIIYDRPFFPLTTKSQHAKPHIFNQLGRNTKLS